MFLVGWFLSILIFLTGVSPIRDQISSVFPKINQTYLDYARIVFFLFFSLLTFLSHFRLLKDLNFLKAMVVQ
jgi:hypothetical protein